MSNARRFWHLARIAYAPKSSARMRLKRPSLSSGRGRNHAIGKRHHARHAKHLRLLHRPSLSAPYSVWSLGRCIGKAALSAIILVDYDEPALMIDAPVSSSGDAISWVAEMVRCFQRHFTSPWAGNILIDGHFSKSPLISISEHTLACDDI